MDATPPPDPFIARFFARIPAETAASFTPAQLTAIRMAFGARRWGHHAVDLRKSFPLLRRRFYLVLLIGAEHRTAERLRAEGEMFGTFGNVLIALVYLGVLLVPLLAGLYLLKWTAGIDLDPMGGVHDVLNGLAGPFRPAGR